MVHKYSKQNLFSDFTLIIKLHIIVLYSYFTFYNLIIIIEIIILKIQILNLRIFNKIIILGIIALK